jgi:hypothetical protein
MKKAYVVLIFCQNTVGEYIADQAIVTCPPEYLEIWVDKRRKYIQSRENRHVSRSTWNIIDLDAITDVSKEAEEYFKQRRAQKIQELDAQIDKLVAERNKILS